MCQLKCTKLEVAVRTGCQRWANRSVVTTCSSHRTWTSNKHWLETEKKNDRKYQIVHQYFTELNEILPFWNPVLLLFFLFMLHILKNKIQCNKWFLKDCCIFPEWHLTQKCANSCDQKHGRNYRVVVEINIFSYLTNCDMAVHKFFTIVNDVFFFSRNL